MEDKEKNQKTVVAFIAGLLIGGLLVWVFSIAPNNDGAKNETGNTEKTENAGGDNENAPAAGNDDLNDSDDIEATSSNDTPAVAAQGERADTQSVSGGSISVNDQPAGTSVKIDSVDMPVENGWIVIHEERADGSLGNALGAARYSKADGLEPMTIYLLRAMTPGATYHAVLYGETAGAGFSLAKDAALMNGSSRIEDSFTAKAS